MRDTDLRSFGPRPALIGGRASKSRSEGMAPRLARTLLLACFPQMRQAMYDGRDVGGLCVIAERQELTGRGGGRLSFRAPAPPAP